MLPNRPGIIQDTQCRLCVSESKTFAAKDGLSLSQTFGREISMIVSRIEWELFYIISFSNTSRISF